MKTLRFADAKRHLLEFVTDAPQAEQSHEGDSVVLLITAEGEITFQETPAIEEMFLGDYPCLFTLLDGEQTLLHTPCHVTLLALEPDQLAARLVLKVAQ